MTIDPNSLAGIDPQRLYPERVLRQLMEAETLTKAKKAGLPSHRFGRQRWVLGVDLIAFVTKGQGPA